MSARKKKAAWKSPESCNWNDEQCILEKINELSKLPKGDEVVVVGDFHQALEGEPGNRIAIIKRAGMRAGTEYSTHLLSYNSDGSITKFFGHYDLTLMQAVTDLRKREQSERGELFGFIDELQKQQLPEKK